MALGRLSVLAEDKKNIALVLLGYLTRFNLSSHIAAQRTVSAEHCSFLIS